MEGVARAQGIRCGMPEPVEVGVVLDHGLVVLQAQEQAALQGSLFLRESGGRRSEGY